MKKAHLILPISLACLFAYGSMEDAAAQNQPNPNMSMTLFPIVKQGDQQFLITPKGFHVAIPGKGISPNAKEVAVYQDSAQNYWYINKHGEPSPVSPQLIESARAQIQAQMNAAQNNGYAGGPAQPYGQPYGAPPYQQYPQPVQQTTVVEQPQNSSSGAGSAALGMMGSAAGAFAGAALGNSLYQSPTAYGVPYGRPVYRSYGNNGNNYYYNNESGNKTYVDNAHVNDVNSNRVYSQFNQQGEWKDRDQWSKNLQGAGSAQFAGGSASAAAGAASRDGAAAGRFGGASAGRFGGGDRSFGGASGGRFSGGSAGGSGGRFSGRHRR